jgi:hypothetical protein
MNGRGFFSHGGDIGDVIWSLPTIRALGGGELVLHDFKPRRTTTPMTAQRAAAIIPLLRLQPYLTSVSYSELPVPESILNEFRRQRSGNLVDMHLATYSIRCEPRYFTKWIDIDEPRRAARIVIAWTPRYSSSFRWTPLLDRHEKEMVFLGFAEEHEQFRQSFASKIERVPTDDLLQAARIIAGAELFIGQQCGLHAISYAMAQKTILMAPQHAHAARACDFKIQGQLRIVDGHIPGLDIYGDVVKAYDEAVKASPHQPRP